MQANFVRHRGARLAGHYWQLVLLSALVVVLLLCGLSYAYGFKRGHGYHDAWLAELQDLRLRDARSQRQILDLSQQLVNIEQGARIDREAAEQVREAVLASEAKIAALKADLVFYRGLMTPTATEQGLGIRSFKVTAVTARSYRYELILQQLAVKHRLLSGKVGLIVQGQSSGEAAELSLQQLSEHDSSAAQDFRFRYFQKLEGSIRLPEGFEPAAIKVTAATRGKGAARVEKRFEWPSVGA